MTSEEWLSLDEIAKSAILMHLAENVYFNMAKETLLSLSAPDRCVSRVGTAEVLD